MALTINSDLSYKASSNFGNLKKLLILIVFVLQILGCSANKNTQIGSINEVVMTSGMSITVENANGQLIITAGKDFQRSFTWAGDTRSVIMEPRKERWNGSLGIYYPGNGSHWKEHDGITRAVLEEGVLHFDSIAAVMEYIERYEEKEKVTYNDNGLFIAWDKSKGAGGTLDVMLWQFLINGKPPNGIPGSHNSKIRIE